ncbi:unnamed protein product, partial [Allacma fusca]
INFISAQKQKFRNLYKLKGEDNNHIIDMTKIFKPQITFSSRQFNTKECFCNSWYLG